MQRLAIILALVAALSACGRRDGANIACTALREARYAADLATFPDLPANKTLPETFEAALDALDEILSPARKAQIRCLVADNSGALHMTIGLWLRNVWLASDGPLARDMVQAGFIHPDDMSAALLVAYAKRLRGERFDLSADVAQANAHWRERGVDVEALQNRLRAP